MSDKYDVEFDEDVKDITPEKTALTFARNEVEVQLDAAHKYRRSIQRFFQEAKTLATRSQSVAESCMYAMPRGGKSITGPSVRLAEICATAWGNLHVGGRVIGETDREVIAQGVCWDLQSNVRWAVEVKRRILDKHGNRYNDDMIVMTGNAAISIALRNAVFRAIPRGLINDLYAEVRKVAVGDVSTIVDKRQKLLDRFAKMGAEPARVFAALGVNGIEDIGFDHIETLIGYGTAIASGDRSLDDVFPPIQAKEAPKDIAPEEGRRMGLPRKEQVTLTMPTATAVKDEAEKKEKKEQ